MIALLLLPLVAHAEDSGPGCISRKVTQESALDLDIVVASRGERPTELRLMSGTGPDEAVGPAQSRLRDRIKQMVSCYRTVYPVGGPGVLLRLSFDLVEGEPMHVSVDGPPAYLPIAQCLQEEIADTPFQCKLSAEALAFPIQFSEPDAAPTEPAPATTP